MTDKIEIDIIEQTLVEIATSKTSTVTQRLIAVDKLRKIEKQRAKDSLEKERQELRAEEVRLRRKEADIASAAVIVEKITAKTKRMAEERRKRAHDKAESRALDAALKEVEEKP